MTSENRLVYFGDKLRCLDYEENEDLLEPKELNDYKHSVRDISVSYNKILIRNFKGEVEEFGDVLSKINVKENNENKTMKGNKVKYKSDALMESIQAGPYHCSSISVSHEVYSWGLDRFGSTGLPIKEKQYIQKQDRFVKDPRSVVYLVREFEKNKEK